MKYISKILSLIAIAGAASLTANAGGSTAPVEAEIISSPSMVRNGSLMTAAMNFDFSGLRLSSNQSMIIEPMIANGPDTLSLANIGVYGRTAWYQRERGILKTAPADVQFPVRYKEGEQLEYVQNVPYGEWMNGSTLLVKKTLYGCANCREDVARVPLASYEEIILEYAPQIIYQTAVAEEVKARELSGRAYVDFPVNQIKIYPDYRNNTAELGKIIATIDSVKNDPDITVTSIFIAGTASPEGPYDNNVYLAKNRTIALKDYVTNLYNFPKDFIQTDYDPVDWKGLREWLGNNSIENREQILAIVNSDIEPYARNSKIKKDFPVQYQWLLKNVYPALRHSDYRIEYQISQYTTVEEIAEIIKEAPQKLSLSEMYTLAGSLQPGTPEYNDVFEIAVRMYPNDETANLNAANAALARGDLLYAARYLEKAGSSPEAVYARGILEGYKGNYAQGAALVEQAKAMGLPNVDATLENMKAMAKGGN